LKTIPDTRHILTRSLFCVTFEVKCSVEPNFFFFLFLSEGPGTGHVGTG
jgi:hypothetical protein